MRLLDRETDSRGRIAGTGDAAADATVAAAARLEGAEAHARFPTLRRTTSPA